MTGKGGQDKQPTERLLGAGAWELVRGGEKEAKDIGDIQ